MKKGISGILILALLLTMLTPMFALAEETKSSGEILKDLGVIQGDGTSLMEDQQWNRQDLAVILSRLLGEENKAKATAKSHTYADVTDSFYDGYLSWALENGYMEGYSATQFGFGDKVTTEQFTAVMLRALGYDTTGANYALVPGMAVEKGLVAQGTDFSENALRGYLYDVIINTLGTKMNNQEVTLGAKLGIASYMDLAVESLSAISKNTIKVTFNFEVTDLVASNFSLSLKDNEYAVKVIDSVKVDGKVATIKLVDDLADDTDYVLVVSNVASKDGNKVLDASANEFTYTTPVPTSISFAKTTVAVGDSLDVVIKDANGIDITENYDLTTDITVETSSPTVVDGNLDALLAGYSVVNVKLNDTEVETGNTIITVKDTLQVLSSIGKWSLSTGDIVNPKTSMFVSDAGLTLTYEVLDQNGEAIAPDTVSYRSLTPTVATIDAVTGVITPINAGNATFVITAEVGTTKVSKAVTVQVKADPVATSLRVDTTSAKLVIGSGISKDIKVEVLDQYGDVFTAATDVTYKIGKTDIVEGLDQDVANTVTPVNGVATVTLDPEVTNPVKGTTNLTFTYGTLPAKAVSVSLVEAGAFAGYAFVADATKLDLNAGDVDHEQGPLSSNVKVYEKDVNGNYIKEVLAGITLEEASVDPASAVSVAGQVVTAENVGTEVVTVKVNNVKIGTLTFTVVDTTPVLTNVSQVKNVVSVEQADLTTLGALFGSDENGAAFVGYNQYGEKVQITAPDVQAFTSNAGVVATDLSVGNTGTATLTLKIADKLYVITVVVK